MDTQIDPYICCLQETHLRPKDIYRLKVKGWENILQMGSICHCKAGVSILMSDKIDLKIKITRDKEGYTMIKGSIQEEDITIVNIHEPNIGAPQYIRQTPKDIKGETDCNTIIVGDFNTQLTPMDILSKQKINKETQALHDTLDEMDLIDIFRTFHPNAKYTFFSSAHGTFSRIDHILCHKSNLSNFKKIEIVSNIFSDHNTMRLDISARGKNCKKHKQKETEQYFLNNQQVTEETKREI